MHLTDFTSRVHFVLESYLHFLELTYFHDLTSHGPQFSMSYYSIRSLLTCASCRQWLMRVRQILLYSILRDPAFLESGPSQHSNSEDMIRMTVTVYFLLCLRVFVRSNIHYHSYNPLARTQAKSIRSYHALRTMTPEFHRLPLLS